MNLMKNWKAVVAGAAGMTAMGGAQANVTGNAIAANSFDVFEATILTWVNGPLGVGLAVTALVIGGGAGIIKSSPLSALVGVVLAAMFAWGPNVIQAMVSSGSGSLL